jgi:hypothetical protein
MKKILLFLTVSACISSASAQITLTRQHIVTPAQKVVQGTDTTSRPLSTGGANMSWDYSGLKAHTLDSQRFGVASWYEGHVNFPEANMTLIDYADESNITFLEISEQEIMVHGSLQTTDSGDIAAPFKLKLMQFPATYQSNYSSSNLVPLFTMPLGLDIDSTGPLPLIDSLQISLSFTSKSLVDGWGTLKTPLGNHACIRQTLSMITAPNVKMFTNGFGFDLPASMLAMFEGQIPTADTTYTVNFWTNDAKYGFPLMSYEYAPGDNATNSVDFMTTNARSSSIFQVSKGLSMMYPNPAIDMIHSQAGKPYTSARILDMSGKMVLEQIGSNITELDIRSLGKGMYLLQLTDDQGAVYGQMFSKQ